ncbi:YciI family protein [Leptospira idonii]|uniref:GTP cyclohydrolase n=1 Tax=Leptospira idonii TaxID=1193500 RepID=A0A4R9M0I4_9LEPT|nr:YciI family protein [Leptospira idonii]TGN18739.1 GTP cyclohydrolase [Leptospira idonii]
MKHFVVLLRYLVPLETVEKFVVVHREYLATGYAKKVLLASGPQNPRSGGVLLARGNSREEIQDFCNGDPFCKEGVAEYQIIEWVPVKWLPEFEVWKD